MLIDDGDSGTTDQPAANNAAHEHCGHGPGHASTWSAHAHAHCLWSRAERAWRRRYGSARCLRRATLHAVPRKAKYMSLAPRRCAWSRQTEDPTGATIVRSWAMRPNVGATRCERGEATQAHVAPTGTRPQRRTQPACEPTGARTPPDSSAFTCRDAAGSYRQPWPRAEIH
jgi:hypothetical protein